MWPVIIVFVLVLGYYYIDSDIESKHNFKKAQGWSAYFQVALKGSEFLLSGIFLTVSIEVLLYASMYVLNIVFFWNGAHVFTFADDLNNIRFKTFSFFSWSVAISTLLLAIGKVAEAKKRKHNPDLTSIELQKIYKKDFIKKLQLESIEKDLFVMITLKSRKVYVGIVDSEKITNPDTHSDDFLSIIPVLSGYRDKDTLDFVETKNYASIYQKHGISSDSSPLSLQQFRHVINLSEVECLSLFDLDVYASFQINSAIN